MFRLLKNLLRVVDPEYAQLLERWVATSLLWGYKPKRRVQECSNALPRSLQPANVILPRYADATPHSTYLRLFVR